MPNSVVPRLPLPLAGSVELSGELSGELQWATDSDDFSDDDPGADEVEEDVDLTATGELEAKTGELPRRDSPRDPAEPVDVKRPQLLEPVREARPLWDVGARHALAEVRREVERHATAAAEAVRGAAALRHRVLELEALQQLARKRSAQLDGWELGGEDERALDALEARMTQALRRVRRARDALAQRRVRELERRLGDLAAAKACRVCFSAPADVVLAPCGHRGVCERCEVALHACPFCRADISGRIRVYDV